MVAQCYAFQNRLQMIFHAGFQTFKFQREFEVPKVLSFATREEALEWLNNLRSQHSDLPSRLREYLTQYSEDPESSRLTDYQAMERVAMLLQSRRILVVSTESRAGGGTPGARVAPAAPAFPLAERSPVAAPDSYHAPVSDQPTFSPNLNAAAQAKALVAAAAQGKPFCPE